MARKPLIASIPNVTQKLVLSYVWYIALISLSGSCFGALWHTESLITHAEELEKRGSYEEAANLYLKAIETLEKDQIDLEHQIQWHAAYASFLSGEQDKTLSILKAMKKETRPEKWFLQGLILRQQQNFPEAEAAFLTFLKEKISPSDLILRCRWELAQLYQSQGDFSKARPYLNDLVSVNDPWFTPLAHFDLAKEALSQHRLEHALKELNLIDPNQLPLEMFAETYALVKSEVLLLIEKEEEAICCLPEVDAKHLFWWEARYLRGWAHLKLASKILYDPMLQESHFDLAIEQFQQLVDTCSSKKEALLSLAQAQFAKGKYLNDPSLLESADKLLQQAELSSREIRSQALLMRAEVAVDYKEKDRLFRLLTCQPHPSHLNNVLVHCQTKVDSILVQGWLLRGLNDLEEGEHYSKIGEHVLAADALLRADHALEHAFIEAYEEAPATAFQALVWRVEALLALQEPASYKKAYILIRRFLKDHIEIALTASADKGDQTKGTLSISPEQSDELYYLYGKAAWHLNTEKGYEQAKKAWQKIYETHPASSWAPTALFSLATMSYYRKNTHEAKKIFLNLQEQYPSSSYSGDALYFASLCAEILDSPADEISSIRKGVWQKYPHSRYAAEAYYHQVPYSSYLVGTPEAVEHLHNFISLYPDSPYVIHAYYLEGLRLASNDATLTPALEAFSLAQAKYLSLKEESTLPFSDLSYYATLYDRSALESAKVAMLAAQKNQASDEAMLVHSQQILLQLKKRLEDEKEKTLRQATPDEQQPLIEEVAYALGQAHLLLGDDVAAERVFDDGLKGYKERKITRGYYLSRLWFDKGKIALHRLQYQQALEHFDQAEDSSRGKILSGEQQLDLWIFKSHCYRHLGNLEQAMWYLSRAVNESIINTKRLEAMYLRAEVYQEQGREELAVRQLQALAATGGFWGEKAHLKLKEHYGY